MNTAVETQWIECSLIDTPSYGRMHSVEGIDVLASDMEKNGQLQNAVVCKAGNRYELIIGKGRLEAARKLGWEKLRVDVKEGLSPVQKLAIVAAENEAREDACPFYTAMLYSEMISVGSLTQQQLAQQIGRNQSYVSAFMKLAQVPREIWIDHQPELISMRLCLEIARAEDPDHQKKLIEAAVKGGLGTSAVRKLAKRLKGEAPEAVERGPFEFAQKHGMLTIKGRASLETLDVETHITAYRAALTEYLNGLSAPQLAVQPVPEQEVMAA